MFCSSQYPGGAIHSPRQSGDINVLRYMYSDILQVRRQNLRTVSVDTTRWRMWKSSSTQAGDKTPCVSFEVHGDLPLQVVPTHVAVIMDGNGRWASERGHVASVGHKVGIDALQTVVESCIEFGVRYLSVFALSTENSTSRNEQEIRFLITLVHSVVHERLKKLHAEGVRLKFVGDVSSLGSDSLSNVIERYVITFSRLLFRYISVCSLDFG
jgi:hypothetical protein